MAVDFRELLSQPMDSAKRPIPLPAGSYFGIIKGREFGVSKNKETPYVRFTLKPTEPAETFDDGVLDGVDFASKTLTKDYYLTPSARYRLKELAESLNIATQGRSDGEVIDDCLNQEVVMDVTQQLNPTDPTAPPYNNVAGMRGKD